MIKTVDLVGRKLSTSNRMIVREAYKRGVTFEKLEKKKFKMKHNGKSYTIRRGLVSEGPNSKLSRKITKYKNSTCNLLRGMGFNAPENAIFKFNEIDRAWNWAKDILPVVIKPNDGIMGKLVFVKIDNFDEFIECYKKVAESYDQILVEEFIDGEEYRFTFVKDEVVAVAKRVPANVVGDGKHSVKELIEIKNAERAKRKVPLHKKLSADKESKRVLKKHGLTFDYVPKDSEVVYLRNNSNISTGGDAIDATNSVDAEIKREITRAIRSIPGLRVCGVDVLIDGDKYNILEINSHAMLAMHEFPWEGERKNVINKVVDLMFPDTIKTN